MIFGQPKIPNISKYDMFFGDDILTLFFFPPGFNRCQSYFLVACRQKDERIKCLKKILSFSIRCFGCFSLFSIPPISFFFNYFFYEIFKGFLMFLTIFSPLFHQTTPLNRGLSRPLRSPDSHGSRAGSPSEGLGISPVGFEGEEKAPGSSPKPMEKHEKTWKQV